ncbi:hypothetical protein VB773_05245 [Haloarculaceae archaeon H-GB2-1]|nr:hypothetical protein [Haloarculaceae archaeon H-GB1-1]MEA5388983.1 hypothetical protein [Haloarculaceae archaeon H-GB11]MEA5407041.1 hypothetical protein [Haloarculaceae archaeon H-GB2-1]
MRVPFPPLHVQPDLPMVVVLVLAGLGTAVLLGLALAAVARRQSRPYLLVALALATLLGRSVVGGLTLTAVLADPTHHLLEHALDVVMAALVIAAVYYARSTERTPTESENP